MAKATPRPVRTNITWQPVSTRRRKRHAFASLNVGDTFRIVGNDAVYRKVEIRHTASRIDRFKMLELATGEVFAATRSLVERISTELIVKTQEPSIYRTEEPALA